MMAYITTIPQLDQSISDVLNRLKKEYTKSDAKLLYDLQFEKHRIQEGRNCPCLQCLLHYYGYCR